MNITYSWIIYSCIIFVSGTGIWCDRKLEKRQAASSFSINSDDMFDCSNGLRIEWLLVCDGRKDCSDGTDESEELCAIYELGTNMTTDCGRVNITNEEIFEEEYQSLNELSSWSVDIYKWKTQSDIDFICAGSIITSKIVISVSYPFRHRNIKPKQTPINDGQYKIFGMGMTLENIKQLKNFINVSMIYFPENYNPGAGSNRFKHTNIAVIVLAKKVSFRNGFAPICIDWFSKYDIQKIAQIATIAVGFKDMRINKVIQTIQYIDNSSCPKYHHTNYWAEVETGDAICIEVKKEQYIKYGVVGAGLDILYSNTYFLTGVMITWFARENKPVERIDFTGIKNYIPWIRRILNKHAMSTCVLPTLEGVIYSYEGSNATLLHGTLTNRYATVIENCDVGYHKAYPYGFRVCQGNGKWSSNSDKLCFKMCPPLESDTLDIKCSHNGNYANCSNLSIPDTTAIASCKISYTAPNGQEAEPLELLCQTNGTWNKKLYRCTPDCGNVYNIYNVLTINGIEAPFGTAPWNVGVYTFNKKTSNYELICGGSIISPNLVVSAARCFWTHGMISRNISIKDGEYKIAVGKYDRNFTIVDNEFTKIINVEIVYVNENYDETSGWHFGDIAIIVLQNRVSFNSGVAPVCIDWTSKYNVVNGDQGKIVGWGKTEKGIESPVLLESSLPYIDQSSCRKLYTNSFESHVTADKFCAGSTTGQRVNYGDSSAGLSFIHSYLYYLTGVVSFKDSYANYSIAAFTEVKYYIQWIRRLYVKHN